MTDEKPALDLESIAASLHDSRHKDSLMSDWARRWGQRLIDEVAAYREDEWPRNSQAKTKGQK